MITRFVALLALVLGAAGQLAPTSAGAFALIQGNPDPAQALGQAARWSPGSGLEDGIQVGLQTGIGSLLAVGGEDPAVLEQAIFDGILPWENAALQFDITLDAGVVEGTSSAIADCITV